MTDSPSLIANANAAARTRARMAARGAGTIPATPVAAAPSRRMVVALATLAAALGLIWLPIHLALPLGREPAIIGLVAQRMLEGLWPYAESWDHRGPVAYALYAALVRICGDVRLGVCVGDLVFLAAAALALRSISRSLGQPWLAPIGAIALVLTVRDSQSYGHPEQWLAGMWLWVLAGLLHPHARARTLTHLLAGVFVGAAIMHKPTSLPLLLLPLAAALRGRGARDVAAVLIGCTAAIAAVVLAFDAGGRLPALVETFVVFNFVAYGGTAGDTIALALARFVVTAIAPWFDVGAAAITLAAVAGLWALWRRDGEAGRLVGLAWLLGLGCALLQGKSSPHHFAYANAVVAFCAAYALSRALHGLAAAALEERQEFSLRLVTIGAVAIAGIALAVQTHVAHAANWWSVRIGLVPAEAQEAMYCRSGRCPAELKAAAELIRRETDRDMPLFVFGSDAGLYLAAERPPATRFLTAKPLVSGPSGWRSRLISEALAALRATPPHFIAVEDGDADRSLRRLTSRQQLEQVPELRALLAARYDLAHSTGRFTLYRLKSAIMAEAGTRAPRDG